MICNNYIIIYKRGNRRASKKEKKLNNHDTIFESNVPFEFRKDNFKNQKCAVALVHKAMITERDGFLLGR